jgi:hypothetical protein
MRALQVYLSEVLVYEKSCYRNFLLRREEFFFSVFPVARKKPTQRAQRLSVISVLRL